MNQQQPPQQPRNFQYDPQHPEKGWQPAQQHPRPKKPMSKEARIGWSILGGLIIFTLGLAVGAAGGTTTTTDASSSPVPTVTVTIPNFNGESPEPVTTPTNVPTVTVTKPAPPAKTVTAPPPQAAATIEEGTWEVGVDVAPGRYKTVEAVDAGMCYWKITTTGKPDNIVDNDIVTGGRPTVTIKKGQDFTTQDCGTWKKVG